MHPENPSEISNNPYVSYKHRNGGRLTRIALNSFAGLVENSLDNAQLASSKGFLQAIDPRAKTIGLISLLIAATIIHSISGLLVTYVFCLILGIASAVPMNRMLRSWLAIPLFTLAFMFPASLNIVTSGKIILHIWHSPPYHAAFAGIKGPLGFTMEGIFSVFRMSLRVGVCVTITLLLASTSSPDRLFKGLRMIGIPKIFVTLLTMMERYLWVISRSAEEIHLAKLSRTIQSGSLREEHNWAAAGIGSLFRRSQSLGQKVYMAMISRGYTGEVYTLDEAKWKTLDFLFITLCAACIFGILWIR
jgi:cobalt/nickel transport system permease protein